MLVVVHNSITFGTGVGVGTVTGAPKIVLYFVPDQVIVSHLVPVPG